MVRTDAAPERGRRLLAGAARLNVRLSAPEASRLLRLLERVVAAGASLNLTAISDFDEGIERHLLDSLAGLRVLDRLQTPSPLVDIGTGAGFPGLVLACVRPEWRCLLVDSRQKRIRFVDETVGALGLTGVTTVWGRAEELGRDPHYRESFRTGVARAVASLEVLAEWAMPLIVPGGCLIAYKARDAEEEAARAEPALRLLGGRLEAIDRFHLPCSGRERVLLVIRKLTETPARYPRRPGIARKRPLG